MDDVIAIGRSNNILIDDDFFVKEMGELESGGKNYPVKVKAINLGWMFRNFEKGLEFFAAILETENIEIYDNTTIKVVIEYIYLHYKRYIVVTDGTSILLKLISIMFGQFFFEKLYKIRNEEHLSIEE